MSEEEYTIFKEDLTKYKKKFFITLGVIIILFLAFFFYSRYNNNQYQQLKGEYKILEEQYSKEKDGVKVFEANRIKEKDSLTAEINKREKTNTQLSFTNSLLEDKINAILSKSFTAPKSLEGLVLYYNTVYNTTENKVIEDKVALGITTATDVSNDLEEGFRASEALPLKNEQLANKDKQIYNLEKDKIDLNTQLVSAEQDVINRKELEKTADKNIENLNSQVSKLKTKSTLNKILVPVSFAVGGFVGYKLAK